MQYNPSTLEKLEKIVAQAGYVFRQEKGSFQSNWCIMADKKIVVLNKYLPIEGKINVLIDIIAELEINIQLLDSSSQKIYNAILLERNLLFPPQKIKK